MWAGRGRCKDPTWTRVEPSRWDSVGGQGVNPFSRTRSNSLVSPNLAELVIPGVMSNTPPGCLDVWTSSPAQKRQEQEQWGVGFAAEKSGFKHGMFSYGGWGDGGTSTHVREELHPPTWNGDADPTRTRQQKWESGQRRPKSSYTVGS